MVVQSTTQDKDVCIVHFCYLVGFYIPFGTELSREIMTCLFIPSGTILNTSDGIRKESRLVAVATSIRKLNRILQDIKVIMEMLEGPRAADAGIVYLQDQIYEFRAKENGKLWTVYGSPVCSTVTGAMYIFWI